MRHSRLRINYLVLRMQNPCRRQAIITLFCECKTPAGGRQYIYRHQPIHPSLRNVAKLIRRRRISLKRDNHLEPIPPQPTLNPSVCPVTTVERMDVLTDPKKNPPSKSLRQKHGVVCICARSSHPLIRSPSRRTRSSALPERWFPVIHLQVQHSSSLLSSTIPSPSIPCLPV